MTGIRVRNAGERAVLLELPDNESARRAATALRRLNGLVDVVPAHRTVLVTWSTGPPPDELVAVGEAALGDEQDVAPARLVEIPVDYAGDDLADVARISSLSTEEVVARHVAGEYVVAFLGFAPGVRVPTRRRRAAARAASGGTASACARGQRRPRRPVFRRLSARVARRLAADRPHDGRPLRPAPVAPGAARGRRPRALRGDVSEIRVISAGPLTTVQDRGRPGWAHIGVPPSGAADPTAFERGNRIVGNDPQAAALEATLAGPRLRFTDAAVVAVTGATADVWISGRAAEMNVVLQLQADDVLHVAGCRNGVRTYVAVRGGVDVEPTLGSRSAIC